MALSQYGSPGCPSPPLGSEKGAQAAGQPELVHPVAVRANMRSILVAMMKSFSCSPLIFLVCRETVAFAPTEADVRMMAFSFRKFTNLLNKGKRLPEIVKPEAPLDEVSFL